MLGAELLAAAGTINGFKKAAEVVQKIVPYAAVGAAGMAVTALAMRRVDEGPIATGVTLQLNVANQQVLFQYDKFLNALLTCRFDLRIIPNLEEKVGEQSLAIERPFFSFVDAPQDSDERTEDEKKAALRELARRRGSSEKQMAYEAAVFLKLSFIHSAIPLTAFESWFRRPRITLPIEFPEGPVQFSSRFPGNVVAKCQAFYQKEMRESWMASLLKKTFEPEQADSVFTLALLINIADAVGEHLSETNMVTLQLRRQLLACFLNFIALVRFLAGFRGDNWQQFFHEIYRLVEAEKLRTENILIPEMCKQSMPALEVIKKKCESIADNRAPLFHAWVMTKRDVIPDLNLLLQDLAMIAIGNLGESLTIKGETLYHPERILCISKATKDYWREQKDKFLKEAQKNIETWGGYFYRKVRQEDGREQFEDGFSPLPELAQKVILQQMVIQNVLAITTFICWQLPEAGDRDLTPEEFIANLFDKGCRERFLNETFVGVPSSLSSLRKQVLGYFGLSFENLNTLGAYYYPSFRTASTWGTERELVLSKRYQRACGLKFLLEHMAHVLPAERRELLQKGIDHLPLLPLEAWQPPMQKLLSQYLQSDDAWKAQCLAYLKEVQRIDDLLGELREIAHEIAYIQTLVAGLGEVFGFAVVVSEALKAIKKRCEDVFKELAVTGQSLLNKRISTESTAKSIFVRLDGAGLSRQQSLELQRNMGCFHDESNSFARGWRRLFANDLRTASADITLHLSILSQFQGQGWAARRIVDIWQNFQGLRKMLENRLGSEVDATFTQSMIARWARLVIQGAAAREEITDRKVFFSDQRIRRLLYLFELLKAASECTIRSVGEMVLKNIEALLQEHSSGRYAIASGSALSSKEADFLDAIKRLVSKVKEMHTFPAGEGLQNEITIVLKDLRMELSGQMPAEATREDASVTAGEAKIEGGEGSGGAAGVAEDAGLQSALLSEQMPAGGEAERKDGEGSGGGAGAPLGGEYASASTFLARIYQAANVFQSSAYLPVSEQTELDVAESRMSGLKQVVVYQRAASGEVSCHYYRMHITEIEKTRQVSEVLDIAVNDEVISCYKLYRRQFEHYVGPVNPTTEPAFV